MSSTPRNPFSDPLIEQLHAEGRNLIELPSGRRIVLPAQVGFCHGVRHAVQLLSDTVANAGAQQRIWLLGAMIHNPAVNDYFVKQGVIMLEDEELTSVFTRAKPEDIFVIPAFGLDSVLDGRLRAFARNPAQIVDSTCPFVRRVWQAVAAAATRGSAIIIHGKPGHQETNGIWSRAIQAAPAVAIVPSPAAARQLLDMLADDDENAPYPSAWLSHPERLPHCDWTLVNQTTMLCNETEEIAAILAKASPASHRGSCSLANTLCSATRARQAEAVKLCAQGCACIIVLGGTNSSNTTQLYRLAVQHTTTYYLESPDELNGESIRHFLPDSQQWQLSSPWLPPAPANIGILVGASCPDSAIAELIRKLHNCA
jgi:4-hydroxy-3-methylbut-2-enyl diphosphate reductase